MPRLSRLFVRAALLYLALGFTFGALLLAHKGVPLHPALWSLLPAHIEFVLVGWMVQLALGVAFWILPRFAREPKRGDERPAWVAFILLNLGIWAVSFVPLLDGFGWLGPAGRAAQAAGVLAFAFYAWARVKPAGA
jgi:hypothetical protein